MNAVIELTSPKLILEPMSAAEVQLNTLAVSSVYAAIAQIVQQPARSENFEKIANYMSSLLCPWFTRVTVSHVHRRIL